MKFHVCKTFSVNIDVYKPRIEQWWFLRLDNIVRKHLFEIEFEDKAQISKALLRGSNLQSSLLGCRIRRLHLCRGVRHLPQRIPRYDIKQSDGIAPVLELWRMWSAPSLLLFPGPISPEVIAPDRVLSIDQIELFEI